MNAVTAGFARVVLPRRRYQPLTIGRLRLLRSARVVADLFDTRFSIFGFRFGLDTVVGLVPGVGDVVAAGASVYLIWVAGQLGLPLRKLLQMGLIAGFDVLLGLTPFVGDVADAIFKAHVRNLHIIEDYVRRMEGEQVPR
jgi:hypothetical protein